MRIYIAAAVLMVCVACSTDEPNTSLALTSPRAAVIAGGGQSAHLFKGIELSSTEKKQLFAINARYNAQIGLLRKRTPNPEGPIDASTLAKLRVLRSAQFVEWRAAMTASHALIFDHNRQLMDAQLTALRTQISGISQ
jgi:hypothetical protein